MKHREGLIIWEVPVRQESSIRAVTGRQAGEPRLQRLVNFYDYLEIQPLGNNEFMIESERVPSH